jgi:spore maturation protein CgeB
VSEDIPMKKILVVGDMFPDSFAHNIAVTLKDMGHVVKTTALNPVSNSNKAAMRIAAFYLTKIFPALEDRFLAQLVRTAIDFQPDLVLSTEAGISPKVIRKIKEETDAAVVCWFPDPIANMGRQYMLAASYDVLFTKEPYMVDLFEKKLNKRTVLLAEACNPRWHKRVGCSAQEQAYYGCDINVAGNMYYYRAMVLEQLMEHDIKIWGPSFPRWLDSSTRKFFQNKYVVLEEKAKAFQAARICLNLLNPTEIYGINCRAFEIAGCGGFQMIDAKAGLENYFQPGKEVVTFSSLKELKDKIGYYLAHDDERRQIALKGCERAHREHTYEHRLKTLLEISTAFKTRH